MGAKDAQIQEAQSNQSALEKESQRLHTTILELDTTSQVHCQGRTFHNILMHVLCCIYISLWCKQCCRFLVCCVKVSPPPLLPPSQITYDTYFIFSLK